MFRYINMHGAADIGITEQRRKDIHGVIIRALQHLLAEQGSSHVTVTRKSYERARIVIPYNSKIIMDSIPFSRIFDKHFRRNVVPEHVFDSTRQPIFTHKYSGSV
mmetsp:Transcript_5353/g.12055  ORF Transcript_5353/g.12055 Transcript_5353/m.12055 type:complete len:105 (-) Transcript_5353:1262-1576(-)